MSNHKSEKKMKKVADTKFYDILNVSSDASEADIKKSFRKLALKWHPDKCSDPEAESKFKEITSAYSILSDPEKRKQYDEYGEDSNGRHDMSQDDLSKMFEHMGFSFGNTKKKNKEVKISNITKKLNVSMIDIYKGSLVEFEVERYNLKNGKQPLKENLICGQCKGNGSVVKMVQVGPGMMSQSVQNCNNCSGEGIIFSDEFFEKKVQTFSKTLPKGIVEGDSIIIENKGHEIPNCYKSEYLGKSRTDINLVIVEKREIIIDGYKFIRGVNRSPFDIAVEINIETHEAICGTYKSIPFLNNEKICIKIPAGTIFEKPQQIVVLPNYGMPFYKQNNNYGDLYVIINVKDKFNIDENKLKLIWNILTDLSMDEYKQNVLNNTGNNVLETYMMDTYRKTDAFSNNENNQRNFNQTMAENNRKRKNESSNNDSDEEHGPGNGRMPSNCAQQ